MVQPNTEKIGYRFYSCRIFSNYPTWIVTWSTTKGDNKKLAIFERKVLRKIFGPEYNLDLWTFERRKNENLYQLYGKPTILTFIRTKKMEWFGQIWRAEDDILKKVITAMIQKKRPLGRPRTRWKYAVKRGIQLVDVNASIELALNRERWRDLLGAAQALEGALS
ncbi:PREDICTED: uncharacterized protein LOC107162266 [Diuraphis noxia]|uniref:uncharacterized protein LOC107162266 n=1 Tax=Diuraphis noxia TaxID=143948 RepID=UPI0007635DF9|nr:PREDICTED: uncharacterized protein LOC107162266 [Diuraphis noxia]